MGQVGADSGTCDKKASAKKTISSSASVAYIGWMENNSGASSRDFASRAWLMAMRGSTPVNGWFNRGATSTTSHPYAQTKRGSAASRRCNSVVPLRIIPTTTIGAATRSSRISGWRRIHSWVRSRIRRLCTMPERRMWVPIALRSARA